MEGCKKNLSWYEYEDYYLDKLAFGQCKNSTKSLHKLKCIRKNNPYYFGCSECLDVFQVEEICLNKKLDHGQLLDSGIFIVGVLSCIKCGLKQKLSQACKRCDF